MSEITSEVTIIKYGKGMNSPKPERRNIYLETKPANIDDLIATLKNLKLSWEFDTINVNEWYTFIPCKYCLQRMKYEHEKFKKGEWVWNRRYCLRHYFVEHLRDIFDYDDMILSNRYLSFTMSATEITLNMKTINYHYDIAIKRDSAIINVNYKGTKYTFKYNNHTNSLPYASSYLTLLYYVLYSFLDDIFQFLEFTKSRKGCAAYFNIFHNYTLVVPTCSPEDTREKTCAFP